MSENYPKNSAGRKMLEKELVPVISPNQTLGDALKLLQEKMKQFETINYIYVVDSKNKLLGVFSVKEIFKKPCETKISDIAIKDVVVAHQHTRPERVALLALKNNLKAIPIVDKEDRLLGVVPSDMILEILHNENVEDALLEVGIHKFKDPAVSIIQASALLHFKKRLPWLILGLVGGTIAAFIVNSFTETLKIQLIFAAFIPSIVYIADAVGAQTQTLYIRSLAIDHKLDFKKYILREIKVGLALALVLALIMGTIGLLWHKLLLVGLVLGLSFFTTIIIAVAVAIALPSLFLKLKLDPAIASGPFATIIRDISSLLIYFLIASTFLNIFA
ncbi:MAG: magnesium transporter [Patescibacteria group bacterium]